MSVFGGPDIITDGLVLHLDAANRKSYPLTGSTIYDLSGNGYNGTFGASTAAPTFTSANGGALNFDGSNDKISTTFKPSGARSYFIWIKYDTISSLPNGFSLTGTQQGGAYNYIGIKNEGYFYYYAGTSGGVINSTQLSANFWYQQGFVLFSDGSRKLYLNGEEIYSTTGGLGGTASWEFSIGCINDNHWVNGLIPVVSQYGKSLTANEVQQNYNALKGRFGL